MRRRLRTLATAFDHLRTAVDPRPKRDTPLTLRALEVPEFDDPGQLTASELDHLRRELANELQRATFTSDPPNR